MTSRKLTIVFFLMCVSVSSCGPKKQPDTESHADSVSEHFLQYVRLVPENDYDSRCRHSFNNDLLGDYLSAAKRQAIAEAQGHLYKIFEQLNCVSAKRYAGLHDAFNRAVLQSPDLDSDAVQALAPVALIYFELGYGGFRNEILHWLAKNNGELRAANEDNESRLSRIGLFIRQYNRLWQLDAQGSQSFLNWAGNSDLAIGDCSLSELITIENEEGEDTLFCPKACVFDLAQQDDDTEPQTGFHLTPEIQQICDDFNQARANKTRPSFAALDCARDFAEKDTSDDFLACQLDTFSTRGALLADLNTERTREDIYAARRCFYGDPPGPDDPEYPEYIKLVNSLNQLHKDMQDAQALYDTIGEDIAAIDDAIDQARDDLNAAYPDWVTETPPASDREFWDAYERYVDLHEARTSLNEKRADAYAQAADIGRTRLNVQTQIFERGWSRNYCAMDAGTCSDSCGIQDQMVQEINICWGQANDGESPNLGGVRRNPLAEPDPRDPPDLGTALIALQECLATAAGRDPDPEVLPNDCPNVTRCPNGEMPNRENCKCGIDQRYAEVPDNCLMYARCADSQLICCPRPIGPEDTVGGDGVFPGAPGDPSPIGERVRLWPSESLRGQ